MTREVDDPCHSQATNASTAARLTDGQHFDAAVHEIARVAGDAELARALLRALAIEHALDPSGDDAAPRDHAA